MATTIQESHTHAHRYNDQSAADVAGIQADYRRELARRLRRLRGVVRTTVGYENDALNLATRQNAADDMGPREEFPFATTAAKQAAFKQQLQTWLEQGVLERAGTETVRRGAHFTGRYARRAYAEYNYMTLCQHCHHGVESFCSSLPGFDRVLSPSFLSYS